jgi:hypothetical protein
VSGLSIIMSGMAGPGNIGVAGAQESSD